VLDTLRGTKCVSRELGLVGGGQRRRNVEMNLLSKATLTVIDVRKGLRTS